METVLKFAPPILLQSSLHAWLFLLLPALGAVLGALLCQGSFRRIIGASAGAAARDIGIILLVFNGWLEPNNPHWNLDISFILAFFSASAAAIMSCLAPYRGKLLLINSAIGGFAGQFLLPYLLGTPAKASGWDEALEKLVKS
jgi:hypothetical protein